MRKFLIFMFVCVALLRFSTSYSNGFKDFLKSHSHVVNAVGVGLAGWGIYDFVKLYPQFMSANTILVQGNLNNLDPMITNINTHGNAKDHWNRNIGIKRLALACLKIGGGVALLCAV